MHSAHIVQTMITMKKKSHARHTQRLERKREMMNGWKRAILYYMKAQIELWLCSYLIVYYQSQYRIRHDEKQTKRREKIKSKKNRLNNEINNICGHDKWLPTDNVNDTMVRYYASFDLRCFVSIGNLLNFQLNLLWNTAFILQFYSFCFSSFLLHTKYS